MRTVDVAGLDGEHFLQDVGSAGLERQTSIPETLTTNCALLPSGCCVTSECSQSGGRASVVHRWWRKRARALADGDQIEGVAGNGRQTAEPGCAWRSGPWRRCRRVRPAAACLSFFSRAPSKPPASRRRPWRGAVHLDDFMRRSRSTRILSSRCRRSGCKSSRNLHPSSATRAGYCSMSPIR